MFAIPMTIVVIMRRLGREHGLDDGYGPGDPSQEPDHRRWSRAPGWVTGAPGGGYPRTVNERVRVALELLPA
jgi:hypothetical protein